MDTNSISKLSLACGGILGSCGLRYIHIYLTGWPLRVYKWRQNKTSRERTETQEGQFTTWKRTRNHGTGVCECVWVCACVFVRVRCCTSHSTLTVKDTYCLASPSSRTPTRTRSPPGPSRPCSSSAGLHPTVWVKTESEVFSPWRMLLNNTNELWMVQKLRVP